MLKTAVAMLICGAFYGCENIPLTDPGHSGTDEPGFYYTAHTDSLSANKITAGGLELLDSAWIKIANEAAWSDNSLSAKEAILKKNVVQLLKTG
jgi:hypothetical protein